LHVAVEEFHTTTKDEHTASIHADGGKYVPPILWY